MNDFINCTAYESINLRQFCFRDGQDLQLGGCLRDFRNRPNPVTLKLRYYENVLTVSVRSDIVI